MIAAALVEYHKSGVLWAPLPSQREELKRRHRPSVQELRGFMRLKHLAQLVTWWRENGVILDDKRTAIAILIADCMAVVRHRANKRRRDLDFPNFQFRAGLIGIAIPEPVAMAALDETEERLARKGADYRLFSGPAAGRMLGMGHIERTEARAWTIAACDVTKAEAKALARDRRNELQRERRRTSRAASGARSRQTYEAESISRAKPWEYFGYCRRTWERKGKPMPDVASMGASNTSSIVGDASPLATRPQSGHCAATNTNTLTEPGGPGGRERRPKQSDAPSSPPSARLPGVKEERNLGFSAHPRQRAGDRRSRLGSAPPPLRQSKKEVADTEEARPGCGFRCKGGRVIWLTNRTGEPVPCPT